MEKKWNKKQIIDETRVFFGFIWIIFLYFFTK